MVETSVHWWPRAVAAEALGMMGRIDPELRLPLCPMGSDNRNQLARVMKEMRLI
jgi:4-hydroxy-tetrahydrodipicolinate synthase